MRVLVTGGAGFIGSHLVRACLDAGEEVRVFDDMSSGKPENLSEVASEIELVVGSVVDLPALERAARGCEVVYHQAAIASVPRSVEDPVGTHAVNATGTLHALEAARRAGSRRFVLASSTAVYGDDPQLPKREDMPCDPRSPYALQKLVGELYCDQYARLFGLEAVALRYFNVFGPRQDPKSEYAAVVPRFATACLRREPAQIHGDGEQSRDFTFVADTVRANLLAAEAKDAPGHVINVAGGRRISLNELYATLQRITGSTVPATHGPPRAGDVKHSLADLSRARTLLGFEPRVSLEDGLRRTLESLEQGRAS